MDFDPEDQEIIRLLNKVKDAEGGYPEHMLVARRHSYLKRMGEINLGIPADLEVKNAVKDVKPTNISPATTTLVETALVVAMIAEASTVAYFYRDRLADFFRKTVLEPRIEEVTTPPVVPAVLEIQEITPSPAWAVTVPSETIWSFPPPTEIVVTITSTPHPGVVENNSINTATGETSLLNAANTGESNVLNSTPGPSSSNNSGNNGNHYGQTPKPERTKENGENPPPNEDTPPKENEEQPPKDNNDKPPKDNNDKPPKN